jgi:hydroxyacylglutathione hydrolase
MLLKYFYDEKLSHASYMVGCQQTNEAIIVDPGRDIDPYLRAARANGMELIAAVETHIHADFVSGARELAERVGAILYLSDEGDENWKYSYKNSYSHQSLYDGDQFKIGYAQFDVLHTPGHTPEHISLVLTDTVAANRPMGIFTGDFVFVGSVGRPDLLEKAAGYADTAAKGAAQVFHSLQRFRQLPDYLQVWPAHGAGSACGKDLGAVPSSTVGYEKLFNPALAYDDVESFVEYLLADQPEPPKYFALMKRVNKEGPTVIGEWKMPERLPAESLGQMVAQGQQIVDTRLAAEFAAAHVPGTINIAIKSLGEWAGWLVDYERPLYLITAKQHLAEIVKLLMKIGIEDIPGYFEDMEVTAAGLATESYGTATPEEMAGKILSGAVTLIDVRAQTEWDAGHLPNARHLMLGYLPERVDEVVGDNPDRPIVVHCRTDRRSAIAASILQAGGAKEVINLTGGIREWARAGLPVEK